MQRFIRSLLLAGVVTGAALAVQGQATQAPTSLEVDLALTYSAQRGNSVPGDFFWQQGGTLELSAEAYRGFGIAASIGGHHTGNIGTGVGLTTVTTTFGPRYTWHSRSNKIAVFGEGLIGEAHGLDSVFPSPLGALTSYDAFALQVGGGVDWRPRRHLALRLLQVDWLRTQFANSTTNIQNNLRLSAGIVFRLQR
jgi:outer membrane immunogenic protein